jgi:hypothetical protein
MRFAECGAAESAAQSDAPSDRGSNGLRREVLSIDDRQVNLRGWGRAVMVRWREATWDGPFYE